jgi:hypothetical protein
MLKRTDMETWIPFRTNSTLWNLVQPLVKRWAIPFWIIETMWGFRILLPPLPVEYFIESKCYKSHLVLQIVLSLYKSDIWTEKLFSLYSRTNQIFCKTMSSSTLTYYRLLWAIVILFTACCWRGYLWFIPIRSYSTCNFSTLSLGATSCVELNQCSYYKRHSSRERFWFHKLHYPRFRML